MRLPSGQAQDEAPSSPTTRYAELQPLQGMLTAAIPLLEKREKKVLEARLQRLRGELLALRPTVDFKRLGATKNDPGTQTVVESVEAVTEGSEAAAEEERVIDVRTAINVRLYASALKTYPLCSFRR